MKIFNQEYRNRTIWIGVYYVLLLLLLFAWGNQNTSPPFIYKIAYCCLLFFPALFKHYDYVPMLFVGFSSIALYGYAHSFMPTYLPIYVVGLIVFSVFCVPKRRTGYKLPGIVVFLGVYTLLVDLVTEAKIENITYSIIIIILLGNFINKDINKTTISKYAAGLTLTTLVLSAYYILYRDSFTVEYYALDSGLERSGWMDPNYFGMVIGMGSVTAIMQLIRIKELGLLEKLFYLSTIILSLPTLVLNASRGAILAVGVSVSILLLFSKLRTLYKVILIALITGFICYLYNNSYFDLLEYRILNDSGTGSGRTDIWQRKLSAFVENPIYWLTGYGNIGGKELGMGQAYGSHNDYIAILCAYGLIGILTFVFMLAYPIIKLKKEATNKTIVIALTVYMFVVCMTLEPYTAGRLPYFLYYLFVLLLLSASNARRL